MSVNIQIADAVVNEINSLEYLPFTAERVWEWEYDSRTETAHKAFVCPLEEVIDVSGGNRDEADNITQVAIAFYKKVSPSNRKNEVDELVDVVAEIKGHLEDRYRLTDFPQAALVAVRWAPVFDPATLETKNTFVSGLTLEYRWLGTE